MLDKRGQREDGGRDRDGESEEKQRERHGGRGAPQWSRYPVKLVEDMAAEQMDIS